MCCAMLLSLIGSGLIIVEVQNGGGRHVADVAPDVYTQGLKINTFTMPVYAVAIAMVKVSVGFALMRIAGHTSWRYLIMTIMVIMSCWAFSSIFVSTFHLERLSSIVNRETNVVVVARLFPFNAILRPDVGTLMWRGNVGHRG